jgi:hypothetical protein
MKLRMGIKRHSTQTLPPYGGRTRSFRSQSAELPLSIAGRVNRYIQDSVLGKGFRTPAPPEYAQIGLLSGEQPGYREQDPGSAGARIPDEHNMRRPNESREVNAGALSLRAGAFVISLSQKDSLVKCV